MLPRIRRRRLLMIIVATFILLSIGYNLFRKEHVSTGKLVYPALRFGGSHLHRSSDRIPHIIHQTWKESDLPSSLSGWVISWRKHHPDWEYWFWTDEDLSHLVNTSFPDLQYLFSAYPQNGYRADAFRYMVLFVHGGVYADLDMESLHPLDKIVDDHDCFLSQEPEEHAHFLAPVGVPLVSNALMACRPGHPFFLQVIDHLSGHAGWFQWTDVLHATGPYMLTKEYHKFSKQSWFFSNLPETSSVYLTPPALFQPLVDKSMLDEMRRRCLPGQGSHYFMSKEYINNQRRMCGTIMGRTLMDKPPPDALTVHHFTHLWAGKQYDPWGIFNSRDIINIKQLLAKPR